MIKKDSTDYSLYLVTDRELAGRRPLCQIVEAAIHGGVTVVHTVRNAQVSPNE